RIPTLSAASQPQYMAIESRLRAMDKAGVAMHALSLTQPMVYWAPPAFALRLCQTFNDACVAVHQKYPDRFVGLAMLPMQEPALALKEFDRVAALPGIRGIYMATHINGRNLDQKGLCALRGEAPAAAAAPGQSGRRRPHGQLLSPQLHRQSDRHRHRRGVADLQRRARRLPRTRGRAAACRRGSADPDRAAGPRPHRASRSPGPGASPLALASPSARPPRRPHR